RATRRACPASTRLRTHSAPERVLPQPRPASASQVRQFPLGGRWARRARGWIRQVPAAAPHGQPSAYQSQGVRSWVSSPLAPKTALSRAICVDRAFMMSTPQLGPGTDPVPLAATAPRGNRSTGSEEKRSRCQTTDEKSVGRERHAERDDYDEVKMPDDRREV